MKLKIEFGMYVRTKDGLIAKYIKKNNEYEWHVFDDKIQWFYESYINEIEFEDWEDFVKEEVTKASFDLIDLIEVGDYVNGYKVIEVGYEEDGHKYLDFDRENDALHWGQSSSIEYDEEIKTIVTKEQFEQMQYVVE